MRRNRDDLFRFVTRRDVPYTNNACERAELFWNVVSAIGRNYRIATSDVAVFRKIA
jgi:hypothetical protein